MGMLLSYTKDRECSTPPNDRIPVTDWIPATGLLRTRRAHMSVPIQILEINEPG